MGVPQIILIVLYAVSLLLNANSHGTPKEGKNNFFMALLRGAIMVTLLIWGGFFK